MTGKKEDGIQVTGIACQMPKNFSEILEATRKERQQAEGQQGSGTRSDAGQQAHIYRLAIPTAKKGGKTQHEEEIP